MYRILILAIFWLWFITWKCLSSRTTLTQSKAVFWGVSTCLSKQWKTWECLKLFKTVIICMPLVALKLLSSLLNTKQVIMLFHHENREVKNSFSVFCIGRILPCSSWLWGTLSPQTGTVGTSPRQHEQALPVLSRLHCGCVSRGKAQWYGVFRGVYPGKTTPHVWTVLKWC